MQQDSQRHRDGSAGDANYGIIGYRYADFRRPDPRIAELIGQALGDAQTVLNVGAGAGSYEPTDRIVTAVEPSASMRSAPGRAAAGDRRRRRTAAFSGPLLRRKHVDLLGASMEGSARRPS